LALAVIGSFLQGCGSGGLTQLNAPVVNGPTPPQVMSQLGEIHVVSIRPGPSPFVYFVELTTPDLAALTNISYVIEPKPGTVSKPVSVSYTTSSLRRRGYVTAGSQMATVPVFGLYANYANHVVLSFRYYDASIQHVPIEIVTSPYTDPNNVYDHVSVLKSRAPGTPLGFDFFALKSLLGSPIVVDTDGNVRWAAPDIGNSMSSAFIDGGFFVGDQSSTSFRRLELDGSIVETSLASSDYTNFHHNIDLGKQGLLVEVNATIDGVNHLESILAEVDPFGTVLKEWDIAALVSHYMRANGDDPSIFVRPGVDWFHLNGATYDKSDDSIVVSSRENYLMKLDYNSGKIIWILGDPTKYWYTFPSLRAKAITLTDGGLYPIGQHAPSITSDGLLMVFNNGFGSVNQPTGASAGQFRTYSAVSAYRIDAQNFLGQEAWDFDYNQSINSIVCSSAYETSDKSILVDYAVADGATKTRLVGLSPEHEVIFDFEYANPAGCWASWNSVPVPFDALQFR
jgi:hypothetical protein